MKYVVGFSPDQGGREALALASVLARSSSGSLVVCTVVPETWGNPSMARVDAEYAEFLDTYAQKALHLAKTVLGESISAQFVSRSAPSPRAGLAQVTSDVGADCLVLGSACIAPIGRFAQGSVTSDLLRSSHIPMALAPRGYSPPAQSKIERLTCAFAGTPDSLIWAGRAADLCQIFGVPLRLATFVVRDKQMYPTGAGYKVENLVSNQLRLQAEAAQAEVLADWSSSVSVSAAIGDGKTLKAAMDSLPWLDQELMIVGSSGRGPLLRAFLGSNLGKLVRAAPIPCILLPRHGEFDFAA
jgi:nucleotide-binding universal stress UspA family protein